MIDFTACPVNKFKGYGGANGNKINIMYDGTSYMLKFPPVPGRNKAMNYTNNCISEYLACHIFESLGFDVQQTLLGTYTDKRGKEKTVVACRDFTADGKKLMEIAPVYDCGSCLYPQMDAGLIQTVLNDENEIEDFYKVMFLERKEKILDYSMVLLQQRGIQKKNMETGNELM